MRRQSLFILAVAATCIFRLSGAFAQEDMQVIDNTIFESPRRPPAVFGHDDHNEQAQIEECNPCHHVYEDGRIVEDESSEDQSCADCHELSDSGRKPGLIKAFHTKCKSCHRERREGPLMCGQCHIRQ